MERRKERRRDMYVSSVVRTCWAGVVWVGLGFCTWIYIHTCVYIYGATESELRYATPN